MSNARFERIATLFRRAQTLDARERESFLAESCRNDSELRREVASLLRYDEGAPQVLDTGSMSAAAAHVLDPTPTRIGRYRILERVGEGGMGMVYRAEQEGPMRRTVAIKLTKSSVASDEAVARFESERQVMAMMNHPNIAQVFDAGATRDRRPWVAMEYIKGQPITQHCEEHDLSIEQKLELFMQVCEGVQHAHRNAIIHRDIKPSNVLVSEDGGKPIPKIIDFGIAKALDRRLANPVETQAGQFVGTPEYMSPEQIDNRRNVDTRTDVYSLGVLLYHLLTGQTPFDLGASTEIDYGEVRRRICDEQPPRPSIRNRRLRGELDWIALKALEKDPARRYASPADLAADVGRHLRGEPVAAGPPSKIYRLRKTIAKHRAVAALLGMLILTLIGSTAITVVQASRVSSAAERATAEAATAMELTEFMVGLYDVQRAPDATITYIRMMDDRVDKVLRQLSDRPILQARLLLALGDAYRRATLFNKALPLLEDARTRLIRLVGADHPATLSAREGIAQVQYDMGRYDNAEPLFVEVLEARRRNDAYSQAEFLDTMHRLASLYKVSGKNDQAVRLAEEASVGFEQFTGPDSKRTLAAKNLLASIYLELEDYEGAAALLVELIDPLRERFGRQKEAVVALYNLASAYANLGRPDEAMRYLRESIDQGWAYPGSLLVDRHLSPLHGIPELEEMDRMSRLNAAGNRDIAVREAAFRVREGRYAEAEALLYEVLDGVERSVGSPPDSRSADALLGLADLYLGQRRLDDAERILLELLEITRTDPTMGQEHEHLALWQLAQCAIGKGDDERAIELINESLAVAHPRGQVYLSAYATAIRHALRGQRSEALGYLNLAADQGFHHPEWLARDLAFDAFRGDPAFEAVALRIERRAF